jgi:signal transduction histidine kinase
VSEGATLEALILHDRRISYATTDRDLVVQSVSDDAVFPGWRNGSVTGQSLLELAPELIGSEEAVGAVLAGELARFQIPRVQSDEGCETSEASYYTLVEMPFRNANGDIIGLIHVVEEVSDAARLEQRVMQHRNELRLLQDALRNQNLQLQAANSELKRLDEVKSAFVSLAAHELRTPLASIAGYVEMLLDGDAGMLSQRQREYLHVVDQSAARLLHMTRDLLDVTRIEAGRLEIILRPTDLTPLISDTIAEQSPQLDAKAQRLILHIQPGLPYALCDRNRTVQIIGNLLGNASKYSPAHSDITVELSRPPNDPSYVQISVTDEGVGIYEADHDRLFRPFFRARNAGETGATGTGLGLYIARSLTELHGGALTFDSAPGQGSTFRVTFPIADTTSLAPTSLLAKA